MRVLALAVLLLAVHGFVRAETHDDIAGKPDLVALNANVELKKSIIAGALQQPHQAGTNLVWCSTLQMCWNELMHEAGGPVEIAGGPELAKHLNEKLADVTQVDPAAVFTYVGSGPDAPKALRAKLQKHFGGQASPKMIPENVAAAETIFYSYLFRNLAFATEFDTGERGLYFKGPVVAQFGVWRSSRNRAEIARQVHIHAFTAREDFVVELKTTEPNDQLLIARVKPEATLQKTIEAVLARLNTTKRSWLEKIDIFNAPALNFELGASFPELKGRITKPKDTGAALVDIRQLIRFRLNEKGAVLKSEAEVGKEESKDEFKPRYLICDGPFLILMLKRDAKVPYFAAWIENEELLVPLKLPAANKDRRNEGNIDK